MLSVHRLPCDAGVIRSTGQCAAAQTLSRSRKRIVLATTVLGSSLGFIDGSVVNVALPAIQADLHAGTAQMQWIVNAYLLMLGALVLVGGAAGDRYGRRRVFLIGIVVFTVASILCALAPLVHALPMFANEGGVASVLVAARALQGVGAALLMPNSLAILGSTFDDNERGAAIGAWAGFGSLTAGAGPVLGGWLVDVISWHAIFLINVPLAAIAIALTLAVMPESRDAEVKAIDWHGALLVTLSLGALCFGLTRASERGLGDLHVIVAITAGVLLFGAFLVAERHADSSGRAPMMPLELFRSADFSGANLLTLLLYFAMGGAFFFLPFELIRLYGYSATAAGSALLPFSVIMALLSGAAGRLADRIGPRVPLTVGPLIAAIGLAAMALPDPGQPYWKGIGPAIVLVTAGMTLAVTPLTSTVMNAVPANRQGLASGINNAVARIAGLLAVVLMTLLFAQVFATRGGAASVAEAQDMLSTAFSGSGEMTPAMREIFHSAFRTVMFTAAVCAALGGVAAGLMIRGRTATRRIAVESTS